MASSTRAAFINVTASPFSADPTGTQDSTDAFQSALDLAGQSVPPLHPNVVFAPAGIYRIDGPIRVPKHVTLEGTWVSPPDCGAFFPSANQPSATWKWWDPQVYRAFFAGTVFVTDYGRGIEDKPDIPAFITLEGPSSILKGIWVYYPWQGIRDKADLTQPLQVVPYQWTVRAESESCAVSEVFLQNSYSGLDFSPFGARHILQHIWGQPLREGIRIGRCFDIGRILDVHFWPFWDHGADRIKQEPTVSTVFRDFIAQHGFALVLFKSDMQIVHDFFAFGYYVGVHLGFQRIDDQLGACTGQFTNLNLDQCTNGIDFHSSDKSGVQITNANIVCRDLPCVNPSIHDDLPRRAIVAHHYPDDRHDGLSLPGGFLSVRGASIYGFSLHSMVDWQSANNTLMISSSWFKNEANPSQFDRKTGLGCGPVTAPIINVGHGRAMIQGNWFQRFNGGDAVAVDGSVDAAIVTGNISEAHAFPNPVPSRVVVADNILLP